MRYLLIVSAVGLALATGQAAANEKLLEGAGDALKTVGEGTVEFADQGVKQTGRTISDDVQGHPRTVKKPGTTGEWGEGMSKPKTPTNP